MLVAKLRSAWNYLQQGEFFAFFQAFAASIVPRSLFNAEKFYLFRLPNEPSHRGAADPIEVDCGSLADVRELVDSFDSGDETTRKLYLSFLDAGAEPWCARENGKIVGVVWLFTGTYLLPWEGYDAFVFRIPMKPGERFVGNVFVDPHCRGRGVFAAIVRRFLERHPVYSSRFEIPEAEHGRPATQGVREGAKPTVHTDYGMISLFSCVTATNPISIRAHEKIGFRKIGSVRTIRVFHWAFGWFSLWKIRRRFFRLHRGKEIELSLESSADCRTNVE